MTGVYEALAVLANGHGSAAGGKLLVITDGRETSHPKLQRLTDQVSNKPPLTYIYPR